MDIVYSKDIDSLPITSTLVDTGAPCINSNLPRRPELATHQFKQLDIELEEYAECGVSDETGEPLIDERYIETGFSLSAYDMMDEAGIFTKLEHLPKYHDKVEELKDSKYEMMLNFYVKPAISWSLECDSNPETSKETFHHLLETIGFTEQNRYGDILSHDERKVWIYFFLS